MQTLVRLKLRQLLKDYSIEEILERGEIEPIDALEYLIVYGALDLNDIVEGTDGELLSVRE